MNKRNLVMSILLGSVLIAGVFSATYAYFAINQSNTSSNVTIVTGNTTLVLEDVNPITREDKISPNNTSITRYLTIRNEGSVDGYAKLLFKNLVNTFVLDDLTYTLEEVNSDKSSLNTPNIIVDNEVVPKSNTAANTELANGLLMPANSSKYYKLTINYNYSETENQDDDLGKVLTSGFIIEEGSKIAKNIYCVDDSNNEIDCPTTFTIGDKIAIGRDTPQYFRYLRTTSTSSNLSECGGAGITGDNGYEYASKACADSANGVHRFLAEYNLKRTGAASSSTAIASDALQDPSDANTNSVVFGASNSDYSQSYVKTYLNNYATTLNTMIGEANVVTVNLLSKAETVSLFGCPSRGGNCTTIPDWAKNSRYWLGSANDNTGSVWRVGDNGTHACNHFSNLYYGARAVVNIPQELF